MVRSGRMANVEICTERLRLVALTRDQLDTCLADPRRLGQELGVCISPNLVDDPARRAIRFKTGKMAEVATELHPWYTYWLVVLVAELCGAGLAGFKGAPDERGEVEIGYGISPAHRNRGYMTEAIEALIAWSFQHPNCQAVLADTLKDNMASQRVLIKAGMRIYYESDEGLCWRIDRACAYLS